jgi:hypothetical protein
MSIRPVVMRFYSCLQGRGWNVVCMTPQPFFCVASLCSTEIKVRLNEKLLKVE